MGISELITIALVVFAVFLVPRRKKTDESDPDPFDENEPPAFI